jgi:hypothetical protein
LPDNGSTADISIGGYAFRGCANLEDFTLSNGNTSIGNYAFWGCINLQMLSLSETPTVTCKITSIGTRAFQGCASLSILGIQKLSGHIASNLNYVSNGSEGAAIVAASTET